MILYVEGQDITTLNSVLCHASVNNILKRLQDEAELDIEPSLSGHSFRVGRALDLLNEGESPPKIILRGGWSAESKVMRYIYVLGSFNSKLPLLF